MSASGQPFQSHGVETSVDIARRQNYQVAPVAGYKRPSTTEELTDASKPGILPKRELSVSQSDKIQDSVPLEFARASLATRTNRFTASRIQPSAGATASEDKKAQGALAPPGSSQNPLLSLSHPKYGLPQSLKANFAALGVTTIYAWQASCLLAHGLLSGERHLVYTAPTGGGKSLVADVLLLKRIIENPTRKAILVLPYVALVQEKLKWMRRIVQGIEKNVPEEDDAQFPHKRWRRLDRSIQVTGFFGGSRSTATWADTDIAVCTIEKVCCSSILCGLCLMYAAIGQLFNQHRHRRM